MVYMRRKDAQKGNGRWKGDGLCWDIGRGNEVYERKEKIERRLYEKGIERIEGKVVYML